MTSYDDDDRVQRRAARLSHLLSQTDVAVPAMALPAGRIAVSAAHRSVVRWRIAAAIALLIAGATGVAPLRAWIVATVRAAWTRVAGVPEVHAPAAASVAPPVTAGAVSFPAGAQVVVRIATRQERGGALTIERASGAAVSAAITGERNAAEVLVGPDGLRFNNRRASTAGYVVRVPAIVTRILVRIGDEPARVFAGPDAGQRFVVELGVRSGSADSLKR